MEISVSDDKGIGLEGRISDVQTWTSLLANDNRPRADFWINNGV